MSLIITLKKVAKNRFAQVAAISMASAPAFADNTAAITDAVTAGQSLVSLTTAGVIGIAALGFGLGMVVSWLRK